MKTHNKTINAHLLFVILGLSMILCRGGDQNTFSSPKSLPAATNEVVSVDGKFLCQHWIHSYEEDPPGTEVKTFRPANFKKFLPSRFRMAYKFASDGTCEWLRLAPTDAHRFQFAKWTINPSDPTILHINTAGTNMNFRITSLTNDLLRIIRVN